MRPWISKTLRQRVAAQAGHRCGYCLTPQSFTAMPMYPETGLSTALFNPRREAWGEHFMWSEDGLRILGRTSCGRATIAALQLNNDFLVQARLRWVMAGWHPPVGAD